MCVPLPSSHRYPTNSPRRTAQRRARRSYTRRRRSKRKKQRKSASSIYCAISKTRLRLRSRRASLNSSRRSVGSQRESRTCSVTSSTSRAALHPLITRSCISSRTRLISFLTLRTRHSRRALRALRMTRCWLFTLAAYSGPSLRSMHWWTIRQRLGVPNSRRTVGARTRIRKKRKLLRARRKRTAQAKSRILNPHSARIYIFLFFPAM
jgi:hypothetical protein